MSALREHNLEALAGAQFDVLVIGGGINGAASAAALAAGGARVALIDRGDFAGFTSQESSNLVWGGIKYMENYQLSLVRDLCLARNRLLRSYPSSVKEIRFLTTTSRGFRHHPLALLAGSWAYWLMGNCFTRTPRLLSKTDVQRDEPVVQTAGFAGAIEYSDAYLYDNDARFVFGFVRGALDRGAVAANYVESLGGQYQDGLWRMAVRDCRTGKQWEVRARALVNAAGAYVDEHNERTGQHTRHRHVFSKGIHLLVDRLTENRRVLAFFADDGRLFFVIPMGRRTCLGTTDTRSSQPENTITAADRRFVLDNINRCLSLDRPLQESDIIAQRCGVRPLAVDQDPGETSDFLELSRRHSIEVDDPTHHLSVFGSKLTDCINVGEEVCERIEALGVPLARSKVPWYGEPPLEAREAYLREARAMNLDAFTAAYASEPLSARLWRRYAARATDLLARIRADPREAEILIEGTEYTRCEIGLTAEREMIVTLEDFLRRRSKIALVMREREIRNANGLMEACGILFGEAAAERFAEYFG